MKVTPEDILGPDVLLIGKTNDILIVGKKRKGEALEIVNAFKGEEAEELYQRLITVKKA
mgnify:CR=1 FL=1